MPANETHDDVTPGTPIIREDLQNLMPGDRMIVWRINEHGEEFENGRMRATFKRYEHGKIVVEIIAGNKPTGAIKMFNMDGSAVGTLVVNESTGRSMSVSIAPNCIRRYWPFLDDRYFRRRELLFVIERMANNDLHKMTVEQLEIIAAAIDAAKGIA